MLDEPPDKRHPIEQLETDLAAGESRIARLEAEIDGLTFRLYGITDSDLRLINR